MQAQRNKYETYIVGNTVRKERTVISPVEETIRLPEQKTKVKSEAHAFFLLVLAIGLMLYACIHYLKVQTDIVQKNREIASLERVLSKEKEQNQEVKEQLHTAISLAEIYRIATKELGMVHPTQKQIISYPNQEIEFVKKYADIPKTDAFQN